MLDIFSKKKIKKNKKPVIIADIHEKNSFIIPELIDSGCQVKTKKLETGDYIINNIIIERKTIPDFISSMLSKRIIPQLLSLQKYKRKLLIIEGIDEEYLYHDKSKSKLHANSIRGFLLSIILEYNIPIILTHNCKDTAIYLNLLAKKQKKPSSLNPKRKAKSLKEQLQYVLEGFPGIGPKSSQKLLKKYKTIKNIINQPLENLKADIGKKAEILKLLTESY